MNSKQFWELYTESGSPGGHYDEHERTEKAIAEALQFWVSDTNFAWDLLSAIWKTVKPDRIGGIPIESPVDTNRIVIAVKELYEAHQRQKENTKENIMVKDKVCCPKCNNECDIDKAPPPLPPGYDVIYKMLGSDLRWYDCVNCCMLFAIRVPKKK